MHQARFVLFAQGNVRNHQGGIDGIIEQGEPVKWKLHRATHINDRIHLLRLFIGVLVGHQLGSAAGCFPVDAPVFVARHIVFDLIKLVCMPDAAQLPDPTCGRNFRKGT